MKAAYPQSDQAVALTYVRDQLATGKTLSGFLSQAVQRSTGELSYMTPRPLDSAEALEFEIGHTFDFSSPRAVTVGNISGALYPTPNTEKELVDSIKSRLVDTDHFCLLENSLAAPSDPWLHQAKSHVLPYGDEVYHLASYSEHVLNAVSEATNVTGLVGMVGRMPDAASVLGGAQHLSLAELEAIGMSAECIIVGAFDGEGYVMWLRK
jgi:hypothetical protein